MTSSPSPLKSRPRRTAEALRLFLVGLICQLAVACATATTPASAAPPVASSGAAASAGQVADAIGAIVREEIAAGKLPGAVVVLGIGDRIVVRQAYGNRSVMPSVQPTTIDTIYDAASLTKVMATSVAIMQLVERGRIELDRPAATYWPAFAANGKSGITVRQLMTHYAALPAGIPTRSWSDTEGALDTIVALKPLAPAGTRFVYSDVDFIVLGEIVRRVSGQPLDAYAARNIFQPLGMRDTAFRPSPAEKNRIAPADVEGGELRWGEVQDPIAYRMGGVAGHAGAFTTADDLTRFAQMLLSGGKGVLKPGSVAAMTEPQSPPGGSAVRGLGWDIDSPYAVWMAPSFSTQSYGHTGYTGTAIWIDPSTKTFLIVLTNRLHPDGKGNNLQMLRRIATVAGAASRGQQSRVMSGIDVLEAYGFRQLAGRRVGLITNRSALDSAGRRTADVLHQAAGRGAGPQLVALFSPEHGLDAVAEGKIASGRDQATGLPVFSLYGETRRPTPAMLAGLDALIFDMQDVGTRYYTYPTTMAYAMEAAAANKLDFFVLDRPDPITASTVQGAVLDDDLTSFITYVPLPVRHGMTLGELARLFNVEKTIGVRLHVITMRRYQRTMWFDQTGFAWVPPSPNLRKLEQAVLYPGVGMIEAANVSVGRGTDSPFELVGAPWIDGKALADHLNGRGIAGVRFEAATFTPREWVYPGQQCGGVRIVLTDRDRLDSPLLGVELLSALWRLHGDRLQIDRTQSMIGSRASLAAVKALTDPRDIAQSWTPGVTQFLVKRQQQLLY
jgi:uncharacterized protein YbbC (DUF1343 family)